MLDESTMENVIVALSLTDQWETCLKLIDDIKRIGKPTSFAYSAVVAAAFHNNKDDLAWNLAQEMIGAKFLILKTSTFKVPNFRAKCDTISSGLHHISK